MITMPMSDAPNIGRAMAREPQPHGTARRTLTTGLRRLLHREARSPRPPRASKTDD